MTGEGPSFVADAHVSAAVDAIRRRMDRLGAAGRAPTDDELDALFADVDAFHRAVFAANPSMTIACGAGCANCCSQVVFDVSALEVARIGRRLVDEGRIDDVAAALAERDRMHREDRATHPRRPGESDDDWTERVAIAFWTRDVPCALLGDDGRCTVHDVRPWSCRRSFAANDPALCRGEHAEDRRRRFFVLEPWEGFDAELAALDRHADYAVDTDRLDAALLRWIDGNVTRPD